MPSLKKLFTAENFQTTIQNYCDQIGWSVAGMNQDQAILVFEMESGREQIVSIIRYEQILEFTVPTMIESETEEDIPHELSTILMKRNAGMSFGFWAIKQINDKFTFCIMHNLPFEFITVDYFKTVTDALYSQCEELEVFLHKGGE